MEKVAGLNQQQRRELFGQTAAAMDTVPAIIEKDFWVVWVLDKLFSHPRLQHILQFKGGTSLSKVFDVIGRFSEDIDLILDWREVVEEEPRAERSKTQQVKFNQATNQQAIEYIRKTLFPDISECLAPLCECRVDADNQYAIVAKYPALYDAGYIRPEILLEIGPLAAWSPSDKFPVQAYAAQHFPRLFERAQCTVPTILPERTFWEKATILHQEAHRTADKPMPLRYSRHYYDLALLAKSPVKQKALADLALLTEVAEFKRQFYPANWARYDLAATGQLRLMPPEQRRGEIAADYEKMQQMIFAKPLSLDEIMATLEELEHDVQQSVADAQK
ncbi:nucleotidyl transferase AbiEii/AbiGii toxin family protein [Aurantivibrio plasticivorans]